MKKAVASIEVPAPRATTHGECGNAAVEEFFFSPRAGRVTSVVICSHCNPSFYGKAHAAVARLAKASAA